MIEMAPLTETLERMLNELEKVWQPFAHPLMEWTTDTGLSDLMDSRDESLAKAGPLLENVQVCWKQWEESRPADQERARVFSARNRLVNLALEASRFETQLETGLRKRIDEGRRQAADSDRRNRAARAYGSMSLR
jgi:hypothetical protein